MLISDRSMDASHQLRGRLPFAPVFKPTENDRYDRLAQAKAQVEAARDELAAQSEERVVRADLHKRP